MLLSCRSQLRGLSSRARLQGFTRARRFRSRETKRSSSIELVEVHAPREVVRTLERSKTIMRSDIVPGSRFPDFELPDHTGKHRTLSALQGDDPMVVVLARGGFCPKDRRQHEGLVTLHREMTVGYCRMVTISTDNLLETNEFRAGVGAHWPFLADPGRKVQKTSTSPSTPTRRTTR
jgi:peroxiredoxin